MGIIGNESLTLNAEQLIDIIRCNWTKEIKDPLILFDGEDVETVMLAGHVTAMATAIKESDHLSLHINNTDGSVQSCTFDSEDEIVFENYSKIVVDWENVGGTGDYHSRIAKCGYVGSGSTPFFSGAPTMHGPFARQTTTIDISGDTSTGYHLRVHATCNEVAESILKVYSIKLEV